MPDLKDIRKYNNDLANLLEEIISLGSSTEKLSLKNTGGDKRILEPNQNQSVTSNGYPSFPGFHNQYLPHPTFDMSSDSDMNKNFNNPYYFPGFYNQPKNIDKRYSNKGFRQEHFNFDPMNSYGNNVCQT